MKILTRNDTGQMLQVLLERDFFSWKNTINIPYTITEIDEIEGNKELCADLLRTGSRIDSSGDTKYYIDNGELYEKDGWEAIDDGFS